jgi:uncharacterized small protein (DUF1192 family)
VPPANPISETPGNAMAIEDDERPTKKVSHEIGQELTMLSVEELEARIALLNTEIQRLQSSMALKRSTRDAADRFFKS